jgi:hypothetical protein
MSISIVKINDKNTLLIECIWISSFRFLFAFIFKDNGERESYEGKKLAYETPEIFTYSEEDIIDLLGPAQTCAPNPNPTCVANP